MANKKFKRFITGLLLSCNVASFSFCSAYDVLTETIANQSESDALRAIKSVGLIVQQSNFSESKKADQLADLCTESIPKTSLEQYEELKKFYADLFKDCCNPKDLKQFKEDFIASMQKDENLFKCYLLKLTIDRRSYERRGGLKDYDTLISDINAAIDKYMQEKFYHNNGFVYFLGLVSKQSNDTYFSLTDDFNLESMEYLFSIPETLSKIKIPAIPPGCGVPYYARVSENYDGDTKKFENQIRTGIKVRATDLLFKDVESTEFKTIKTKNKKAKTQKIKRTAAWEDYFAPLLANMRDNVLKAIDESQNSSQAKTQRLLQGVRILSRDGEPIAQKQYIQDTFTNLLRRVNKGRKLKNPRCFSFYAPGCLRAFTHGGCTVRKINSCVYSLSSQANFPKIILPAGNLHLKEHFNSKETIENNGENSFRGKFNTPTSIFESVSSADELLDFSLGENQRVFISTCNTVSESTKPRNNYVFYIYDYDKYGFVKTGEVYDSTNHKWKPAYAIMFVTNENNELITTYPLYM